MSYGLTTPELRRSALQHMMEGRAFDEAMVAHNPHWHESRGEEGVYVGAFCGLRESDVVAPHFRGSCGVSLLRGADPLTVASSVFGKTAGPSGGRWRGDICPTPTPHFIGMFSGALGGSVAYATGAALRIKLAGLDDVVVTAFGDGTANAGIVYESMNLASLHALPVVYVCQNNQYATSLRASDAIAGGSMSARAEAMGIPASGVDGNDVLAVAQAVQHAVARARSGEGPALIDALTYRLGGHFINDPETYRSPDEVQRHEAEDPLIRLIDDLGLRGECSIDQAHASLRSLEARMDQVVRTAKEAPEVPGSQLDQRPYLECLGRTAS